jgi:hypothetical protein
VNGRLDMSDGSTRGFLWPGENGKYYFEGALIHRVWREPAYCTLEFDETSLMFQGTWYHGDQSGTWTGYKQSHATIDFDAYPTYRLHSGGDKKPFWCSADGRLFCNESHHLPV